MQGCRTENYEVAGIWKTVSDEAGQRSVII